MAHEKKERERREEEQEQEERGFRVTDRRIFTAEGEVRQEPAETAGQEQKPPRKQEPPKAPRREEPRPPREEPSSGPQGRGQEGVDFSSFVLSLATTGMVHLGEIPEPMTGRRSENLAAAREMIDILALLKEKTEGNLSTEENQLLDNVLYELRMKFMSKSKAINL